MTPREIHWSWEGGDIHVAIEQSRTGGILRVHDEAFPFQILERSAQGARIDVNGKTHQVYVLREANRYTVWCDGITYRLERTEKTGQKPVPDSIKTGEIRAAMPGRVLRLNVAVNATVAENETVAILESMKMESAIRASKAGRVVQVLVHPGEAVELGELLIVIE